MEIANEISLPKKQPSKSKVKKDYLSTFLRFGVTISTVVTVAVLLFIIVFITVNGVKSLTPEIFAWNYNTTNVSMMPAIINTVIVTFMALLISLPIGIFSAIYLVEYAKRGSKIVEVIRLTTETLSGIPSIVYGLFGFLFFSIGLGWGNSLLGGILTLSIMILPLIIRTAEEALKAVPDSFREGSFALGAGKLRTVFVIILPSASKGILAGIILAIGRIVGETAALIYTAGTYAAVPKSLMNSGRTLAVHMYALMSEGQYVSQAYATALVLLLLVIIINWTSSYIVKKFNK